MIPSAVSMTIADLYDVKPYILYRAGQLINVINC